MTYIILIAVSFGIGVAYSEDVIPLLKKLEQRVLNLLAKRMEK
jgi:hypothetical protein